MHRSLRVCIPMSLNHLSATNKLINCVSASIWNIWEFGNQTDYDSKLLCEALSNDDVNYVIA